MHRHSQEKRDSLYASAAELDASLFRNGRTETRSAVIAAILESIVRLVGSMMAPRTTNRPVTRMGGAAMFKPCSGPILACLLVAGLTSSDPAAHPAADAQASQRRPNIVLILADNVGWGEVEVYGSVRGVPQPRLDKLAAEGMRLTNFNVELSCTVSRAALLTGRYAVRTGANQDGITLWEITIAEALKTLGYATALFGKWHLGGENPEGRREPTDQGFDEFYGIPRTSNEAQTTSFPGFDPATMKPPYIWEGRIGEPSRNVKVFDLDSRRMVDREAALRGIAFMERSVKENKPFFFYYPMTQIHFPTLAHPDFDGKTGAGDIGDAMADVDYNVGLVLDAIERLGISKTRSSSGAATTGRKTAAMARFGGTLEWLLQYGDGRRNSDSVHHSLARPDSRRSGIQ